MLPMFRGAEKVFRHILVPIAGLQELLVRKDADQVMKQAMNDLPPERRALVLKEIAGAFEKGATAEPKAKTGPVSPSGYTQIV